MVPGPLFDFGVHMFHNSKLMMAEGNGPFFYLPKVRHKSRKHRIFKLMQGILFFDSNARNVTVLADEMSQFFFVVRFMSFEKAGLKSHLHQRKSKK